MDTVGQFFSGGGVAAAGPEVITSPDATVGGISIGLPPGGSVETGPGGVAPGQVFNIPDAISGAGGGMGSMGKILAAIPMGVNAIRGLFGRSPTEANISRMGGLSKTAGQTGKGLLSSYNKGQLTGPQQAEVDQFKKAELAKWRQYLADAGIPESTAMVEIENKVEMDAAAYAQKLLQQNFQNAMTSMGLAQGSLTQQAYQNWLIDQQSQKAMADAMAAIAGIFGSS